MVKWFVSERSDATDLHFIYLWFVLFGALQSYNGNHTLITQIKYESEVLST
jgi:hypothetical protein